MKHHQVEISSLSCGPTVLLMCGNGCLDDGVRWTF